MLGGRLTYGAFLCVEMHCSNAILLSIIVRCNVLLRVVMRLNVLLCVLVCNTLGASCRGHLGAFCCDHLGAFCRDHLVSVLRKNVCVCVCVRFVNFRSYIRFEWIL